jgi:hypothetical protein
MNHVATLSQLVCTAFGVAGILWGASARHATFETLTAHELKIVDAEGKERIVLSCPTPGRSEVKLLNGEGQARAVLSVTSGQESEWDPKPTDDTRLDILDRKGSRMASFFVEDGYHHGPHQGLAYYYGDAEPAIALEVSQGMGSGPHLSFWSGKPHERVVSLAAGQASDAPSLLLRSVGITIWPQGFRDAQAFCVARTDTESWTGADLQPRRANAGAAASSWSTCRSRDRTGLRGPLRSNRKG